MTQLNSKWLEGFLHVLKKYIYDLFHVFRSKSLNLLCMDFNVGLIMLLPLYGEHNEVVSLCTEFCVTDAPYGGGDEGELQQADDLTPW